MLDSEAIPAWLLVLFAIALLVLIAYLVNSWRQRRAMERKNANIIRAQRKDAAKWHALQEKLREQQADDPPA
jgi:type VI protein secretion system component VasK